MAKFKTGPYTLDFTERDWQEIEAMGFDGFEPNASEPLTRGQWLAIAHMALGKAVRIESGHYGDMGDEEEYDAAAWAEHLRQIAEVILNEFRPGDGKL